MQVVCANCQLSFQAPEGAVGLMCPICRSPLRPAGAAAASGPSAPPPRQVLEWAGGTLDDLIALLSTPAWSARVEVFAPGKNEAAGEVHVIAGGVADAIHGGTSSHDSLDNLRAITGKGTRFRVEPRLPNAADGNLSVPGPEQGKLDDRPLATLMRYCEDFVLTCGIEVWRGNENAKVEYRRGDIVGVTVGGIDAPERLAEVMKWASGSYRLVVPKLTLPDTAPRAQVAAAPAPVTPRVTSAASKTIFGMPAIDVATIAAARAKGAMGQGATAAAAPSSAGQATAAPPIQASSVAVAGSSMATPSAAASSAAPLPVSSSSRSSGSASVASSGRSPLLGSSAAGAPSTAAAAGTSASVSATSGAAVGSTSAPASPPSTPSARHSANRTIFGVPSPPIRQSTAPESASGAAPLAPSLKTPDLSKEAAPLVDDEPTGAPSQGNLRPLPAGKSGRPAPVATLPTAAVPTLAVGRDDERTAPTTQGSTEDSLPASETAVWTYVGVGFVFGLAALGVYRLVMVFAH